MLCWGITSKVKLVQAARNQKTYKFSTTEREFCLLTRHDFFPRSIRLAPLVVARRPPLLREREGQGHFALLRAVKLQAAFCEEISTFDAPSSLEYSIGGGNLAIEKVAQGKQMYRVLVGGICGEKAFGKEYSVAIEVII